MGIFKKKDIKFDKNNLPNHIGIIMDGNGRWAKKRGLPRSAGHVAGAKVFKEIAFYSRDIGIKNLTVYAFSTENWNRPKDEVDKIIEILEEYVDKAYADFENQHVRVRFLGDKSRFPKVVREKMEKLEKATKIYKSPTLNVAMNYGGRDEIKFATQKIAQKVLDGELKVEDITEKTISENIFYEDLSECDLIIRPSGELRLSNFLLWQSAYSEFWFSNVLWPDFKKETLNQAIHDFQLRNRRFGKI